MKKAKDYGFILKERLDLIPKDCISYEYQVTTIYEDEHGLQDMEFKSVFTNNIKDLDEYYKKEIDEIEFDEVDNMLHRIELDDRFPFPWKDTFYEKLKNEDLYEVKYNEYGKIIYIKDKRNGYKQSNLFDENNNILLSVLNFGPKDRYEYRKEYIYDEKNRLSVYRSTAIYDGIIEDYTTIASICYNDYDSNKTSMTKVSGQFNYKIFTQWDDEYKRPLFNVFMKYGENSVYDISEYIYEGNKTIIKSKHMNIVDDYVGTY